MQQFINKITLTLVDEEGLEAEFPHTSFPKPIEDHHLAETDWAVVHEDVIPEIDSHQFFLQEGEVELTEDGRAVRRWVTVKRPVTIDPVVDMLASRLKTLNLDYGRAVASVRSTYPEEEISTWSFQLNEARVYDTWRQQGSEGSPPDTPFITALDASRTKRGVGNGLDDLVNRILRNELHYRMAMVELTAARHAAEQALEQAAVSGLGDLMDVKWDFMAELAELNSAI